MFVKKLGLWLACAFFLCACVFVRITNVCAFSAFSGEREFYLYSASSQAKTKRTLGLGELGDIKGESITLDGVERNAFLKETLEAYTACVLWEETCADTTSYYCYSPRLQGGVLLNGKTVNLHIAFSKDKAKLGTPLIFGGF